MRKILKTYEAFVADKNYSFEQDVIDPILECIRDNQDYLCQDANLPQLAKLGYMYNFLWYAGRMCWGSEGIIRASNEIYDCEENPKYKIEMCNPNNEHNENLIYDAWAMHVTRGNDSPSYKEFYEVVKNGRPLSELDKKMLKPNKTLEDWVEVLTDEDYRYSSHYPNRKAVLNNLLCTIGTGYSMSPDGFIINSSGGAGQDKGAYGDWENAKFREDIQELVDSILAKETVKMTLDKSKEYIKKIEDERHMKDYKFIYDMLKKNKIYDVTKQGMLAGKKLNMIMNTLLKGKDEDNEDEDDKEDKKYKPYYPISTSSTIWYIADKESQRRKGINKIDQSYIDGAIEVCKDILAHEKEETGGPYRSKNVEYAKKILGKLGVEGFEYKEAFDKYELLEKIEECFLSLTDDLARVEGPMQSDNSYNLRLNDTATSEYGDNNYYIDILLDSSYPKANSIDTDVLRGTQIYEDLVASLDRLKLIKEIKLVLFYYDYYNNKGKITIEIYVNNPKYAEDTKKFNEDLVKQGFEVGKTYIEYEIPKLGIKMKVRTPKPLGSTHPNNKTGKEIFSNATDLYINDLSGNQLFKLWIDERKINILSCNHMPASEDKRKLVNFLLEMHKQMKESNKAYGTYENDNRKGEGTECLYAHDFMLWVDKHANEFKK